MADEQTEQQLRADCEALAVSRYIAGLREPVE